MNKKNKYHIDVTPEEDELYRDELKGKDVMTFKVSKFTNKGIIAIVIFVHLVGAFTLLAFTPKKQQVVQGAMPVVSVTPEPTPVPTPEPTPMITPAQVPAPSPVLPVQQPSTVPGKTSPSTQTLTYTVKSGDTFYSIVKKYKLNSDALIKLNNIKDPSKLNVGQVLKFK